MHLNIFRKSCRYYLSIAQRGKFPNIQIPEIAFLGKSNVGKSSLMNVLVNRKSLVRTSNTPGSTIKINFFNLADQLILVDLPGYGYTKRSKELASDLSLLTEEYLNNRKNLKLLIIIVDSRRRISKDDELLLNFLQSKSINIILVFNKIDKLNKSELQSLMIYKEKISKQSFNYKYGYTNKLHEKDRNNNTQANNNSGYELMNNIEKACIEKNLKLTSQRKIIAEVLSNSDDHPNVEELYARANNIDSKISLATVYRTLNLFEQFGLIKKLEIGEGKARYEEFKKSNEHFHLVNLDTGDIVEFQSKELENLKRKIANDLGFKLINSRLELYGKPLKK